ncbi:hypothetical protein Z948_3292 [Sulfitobacter donghicola DSW-25 = KCTC 12864 = JCM 14565]|nr:hypothetical protein Z948_3292 [Sulfitobacter donghicola DSW-25 = KCTC 12864 = JCM 14565]
MNFILLTACLQDRKHRSSFTFAAFFGPPYWVFRIRFSP